MERSLASVGQPRSADPDERCSRRGTLHAEARRSQARGNQNRKEAPTGDKTNEAEQQRLTYLWWKRYYPVSQLEIHVVDHLVAEVVAH